MFIKISEFIRSLSSKWKIERFFSYILTPLWFLTFYFLHLPGFFPAGINKFFLTRSGTYLFWVTGTLSIIFFIVLRVTRGELKLLKKSEENFSSGNLILLLLPLTPVAQYILSNRQFLTLWEALYVFFVFTFCPALIILLIPILFKRISASQIMMCLGLALSFSILDMALLSRQFSWYQQGSLKIQFAVFAAVFILSWLFFYIKKQKLLYILIVIMFISTCITQFFTKNEYSTENVAPVTDNELMTLVDSKEPKITPSIYFLVYDSYIVNETMLSHGIDNQAQEQYLEDLGFKIYRHNYSLAADTENSISRVLNASTELYGSNQRACAGDGVVQNLLKRYGYKTYGIFPWVHCFRGYKPSYDYSVPSTTLSTASDLIEGIMMGEFLFNIGYTDAAANFYNEEKNRIFSEKTDYPKIIYTHSLLPGHTQNSGQCLPDNGDVNIYRNNLQEANLEMKQDLKTLLENDPNAIIIVAGDHGPHMTKNCYGTGPAWVAGTNYPPYDISEINRFDIQDRFGDFLAIRWPTQDFEEYDDITVLQDLFPAIFAYMFQDPTLLEAKVEPVTITNTIVSDAEVANGIIVGGINNGEPLFLEEEK